MLGQDFHWKISEWPENPAEKYVILKPPYVRGTAQEVGWVRQKSDALMIVESVNDRLDREAS